MRSDYFQRLVPIRLEATKATENKLKKIQNDFFPSFSQSSVVKILCGVFVKRKRLVVKECRDVAISEAMPGKRAVEVSDCSERDMALLNTVHSTLEKESKRASRTRLLTTIVNEF